MIYDDKNKTITTNRLILRLFQKTDAPAVAKLCNNYNIYKNTLYLPYPYSLGDALSWIERHLDHFNMNKLYEFAITDKETKKLYGAIALSNNHHFHNGEMAYWIGEVFWGNGYATEAAQAILQFAFNEKEYHKVFARSFHSNSASERVLQKIGMEKEGVLSEHVIKEGHFEDLVYYGIINSDSAK
ncbi:MAG TPA: GNAT family N-acetyltransferase [Cerasibacillus sp.]|uniref:GNAT family N-acetyltransferase n=1 Tax=Cerasibacillus sp. TaxID=2498711 RepID=UPI002F3F32E4